MNKKNIIYIVVALLLSSLVLFAGYRKQHYPKEAYRVYLHGETIGYISSKEVLENYIDSEQSAIKEKYGIDKVYSPNDLDIVKETTYNDRISTEKEIYEEIKDKSPFTINGYIITIKGVEEMTEEGIINKGDATIYVLDKEIFDKAVKTTVLAFIPENDYNNFLNNTQPEIKTTGTIIESISIKNEITIKEGRIPTEGNIFLDVSELTKFLLFGTIEEQKKYKVKLGDTISEIAYQNKLSTEEFLIANTQFTSEDNLLYEGQTVNLGRIDPKFSVVEVEHTVEIQTKKYETKIEYDATLAVGVEKVKQNGANGSDKVTKKVQKVNGEIKSAVIASTEEIKPTIDKIIVRGNKKIATGNLGIWAWPTKKPYIISSPYGWRWGKLHEGIDISGPGYGSPIYAANNGKVVRAGYTSINGNYIYIDHNNGYYTVYAHLATIKVQNGQIVSMGQLIGTMGATGYAFGTHLHFAIYKGFPYLGGYPINPYTFY